MRQATCNCCSLRSARCHATHKRPLPTDTTTARNSASNAAAAAHSCYTCVFTPFPAQPLKPQACKLADTPPRRRAPRRWRPPPPLLLLPHQLLLHSGARVAPAPTLSGCCWRPSTPPCGAAGAALSACAAQPAPGTCGRSARHAQHTPRAHQHSKPRRVHACGAVMAAFQHDTVSHTHAHAHARTHRAGRVSR
jgi:hypothetical protein